MSATPRVSVIMAVRNMEPFLDEALSSIQAQTYRDFEVVLVDGHSTDRTWEIANAYPFVRAFHQETMGFEAAYNQGLAEVAGELIAFLDGDDHWPQQKLARQVAFLDAHPDVQLVLGMAMYFKDGEFGGMAGYRADILESPHVAKMPGSMLARRSVFDQVGIFETHWEATSDIEWFLRVEDAGISMHVMDEVVIHKRIHQSNFTSQEARKGTMSREIVEILRGSIQRKREKRNTDEV